MTLSSLSAPLFPFFALSISSRVPTEEETNYVNTSWKKRRRRMETAMPCNVRAPAAFILFSACLSRYAEVMMMPAGMHGRGILAFTDGRLITHASSPFTEIAELGHGAVIIG